MDKERHEGIVGGMVELCRQSTIKSQPALDSIAAEANEFLQTEGDVPVRVDFVTVAVLSSTVRDNQFGPLVAHALTKLEPEHALRAVEMVAKQIRESLDGE